MSTTKIIIKEKGETGRVKKEQINQQRSAHDRLFQIRSISRTKCEQEMKSKLKREIGMERGKRSHLRSALGRRPPQIRLKEGELTQKGQRRKRAE